jgi:hypothetical protein
MATYGASIHMCGHGEKPAAFHQQAKVACSPRKRFTPGNTRKPRHLKQIAFRGEAIRAGAPYSHTTEVAM